MAHGPDMAIRRSHAPASRHGTVTRHRRPGPAIGRTRRWFHAVTERSDALDLEHEVFKLKSARAVAESLRRSAERSTRRKAGAFQSAMSMLNFYINRAGRNLSAERRRTVEQAKDALRRLYGRA